jgi:hypothetical protein
MDPEVRSTIREMGSAASLARPAAFPDPAFPDPALRQAALRAQSGGISTRTPDRPHTTCTQDSGHRRTDRAAAGTTGQTVLRRGYGAKRIGNVDD